MDDKIPKLESIKIRDESAREAWYDFKNQYLPKAGLAFIIIVGMVAIERWQGKGNQTNKDNHRVQIYAAPQSFQDYESRNNQSKISKMYRITSAQIENKCDKSISVDKNYMTIDAKF